jgi:lipoate-protein ligase A
MKYINCQGYLSRQAPGVRRTMKFIKTDFEEPWYNFALEEYLLTQMPKDDYLFFYIHKPSIIIGKHQNTFEEVNLDYVKENKIMVARRLSGGGAVYHDHGNLNFSFIQPAKEGDMDNFGKFVKPVIEVLKTYGVDAELKGRNDIVMYGRKISGNAQYLKKQRILHHGTLLFNTDLEKLEKALKPKDIKIESKGIKSVKSRVVNLSEVLPPDITIKKFKKDLINYFRDFRDVEEIELDEKALDYIQQKVETKYKTWEWNYGENPAFTQEKSEKFEGGLVEVKLNVSEGIIRDIRIYGDFFEKQKLKTLIKRLIGIPHREKDIKIAINGMKVDDYIVGVTTGEFISLII